MEELNARIRRAEEEGNREALDRFLRERRAAAEERARLSGGGPGRPPGAATASTTDPGAEAQPGSPGGDG
jgi:hypothetical protein